MQLLFTAVVQHPMWGNGEQQLNNHMLYTLLYSIYLSLKLLLQLV